jgi:hypothetical protein
MSWWQSGVIALAGALVGAGIQGAVTLLVFRAQTRRDRDLQWRTDRRDVYTAFLAATYRCAHAGLYQRSVADDPAELQLARKAMVAARDDLVAVGARLALMAPDEVVTVAERIMFNADIATHIGQVEPEPSTDRLLEGVEEFERLVRADLGLPATRLPRMFLPPMAGTTPPDY